MKKCYTIFLFISILISINLNTYSQSKLIDSLNKVLIEGKLDSPTVKAALTLGKIFRDQQDSTKSADNYLKALTLAKKVDFKRGVSLSYIELGYLYELTDDLPKAKQYYTNAIAFSKKYQIKKELALSYSYMYFIYSLKSEFNNAIKFADSAATVYNQLNRKIDLANQYNNIGLMYYKQNKNLEAVKYYQKSLPIYEDLGDGVLNKKVNTLNNMGLVFEALKSHDQAIKYFKEVIPIAKKLGLDNTLSEAYNGLGNVYLNTKKYKQALFYYKLSLPLAVKSNKSAGIGVAYANLAVTLTNLKEYDQAEKYTKLSNQQYQLVGNKEGLISNLINYAQLLAGTKRLNDADLSLKKAMEMANKYNFPVLKQNIFESMAEVSKLKGEFTDAYLKQDSAYKLQDKNFNFETNKQIANLEVKYKTAEKEKEILANKASLLEANTQIEKKNFWLIIIGLGILLIAIASYLLLRNAKLKQQKLADEKTYELSIAEANAKNQIQEEKLRISQELHDNIGSQLTFISNSIESFEAENGAALKLDEAKNITKNTIRELRRSVWLINQPEFSLDEFVIKLRDYVKPMETGKPLIQINSNNQDIVLQPIVATNLFRVIQEAINNAIKYAQANLISVDFNGDNNQLNINIKDDGNGFETTNLSEGYGLKNMKARVNTLKGEYHISSTPNEGTQINIILNV